MRQEYQRNRRRRSAGERYEPDRRMDVAPHRHVRHHSDAPICGHRFDPLVEVLGLDDAPRPLTGRPRPRTGGALLTFTTRGHCGMSSQCSESRDVSDECSEQSATRCSSNRCTPRTGADDGISPRTTAMSIDACRTPSSGSSHRTKVTVFPELCSYRVTASCAPRVGQQPAEPQPDCHHSSSRGNGAVEVCQHTFCVSEELTADAGKSDVTGTAVEQGHLQRALELLDRARERRLRDRQLLGRSRERPRPGDGGECPQVAQFDIHVSGE
jgi:hypothetical protein